jgi:hypothetical protein
MEKRITIRNDTKFQRVAIHNEIGYYIPSCVEYGTTTKQTRDIKNKYKD